jgi:hypothetical protein
MTLGGMSMIDAEAQDAKKRAGARLLLLRESICLAEFRSRHVIVAMSSLFALGLTASRPF